jgi:hypothetical protein
MERNQDILAPFESLSARRVLDVQPAATLRSRRKVDDERATVDDANDSP